MQEEQTVTFNGIELNPEAYIPWYAKLLILYLFILLVIMAVRAGRITWALWKHRKSAETDHNAYQGFWELNRARAVGFRKFSHLTLLLNTAVLTLSAADLLINLGTAKTPSWVVVARGMVDPLRTFTVGLLFCAGLYLCATIFEATILRQQLRLERDEPIPTVSTTK